MGSTSLRVIAVPGSSTSLRVHDLPLTFFYAGFCSTFPDSVFPSGSSRLCHLCWGNEQISIPMLPGPATALQIYDRSCCDTALPRVGRGSSNLSSRFGRIRCSAVATVAPEARDDYTQGAVSCYAGWQIYEDGPTTSARTQQ